ncbi:hypothetical protein ACUV84_013109 [Puccinellia chinampoensis]
MGRAMIEATSDATRKSSWPELVGWHSLTSALRIKRDRPDIIRFELHLIGAHVQRGHDEHRVRLFLEPGTGIIAKTPVFG